MKSKSVRKRARTGESGRRGSRASGSPRRLEGADLGPALEFLRLLWAVDHALQTASRRMARRIGVSGPQRVVLRIVGKRPGISPGEVAFLLHLHPSSVTPLVQELTSRRLLIRVRHASDGRRVMLWLTAPGRRIDRRSAGTVEAAVRRVLAEMPSGLIEGGRAVLAALERALDAKTVRGRFRSGRSEPLSPRRPRGAA